MHMKIKNSWDNSAQAKQTLKQRLSDGSVKGRFEDEN